MLTFALCSMIFVALINLLRFFLRDSQNRLLVTLGIIVTSYSISFYADQSMVPWLLFLPIWIAGISYKATGGLLASIVNMLILSWQTGHPIADQVFLDVLYVLLGVGWGQYMHSKHQSRIQSDRLLKQLRRQSKDLNIVRHISTALQSTHDHGKLLHIVLTAITAGYGHGINRAMLFLVNEDQTQFKGALGIGSISEEEGLAKWYAISKGNMTLGDYITNDNEAKTHDVDLNGVVKNTTFTMDPPNVLSTALFEQSPKHITKLNLSDDVEKYLANVFNMDEFAVVPLVIQGENLGVILLDNNIKKSPITREQLDSIIPLANQAAIAIHNTQLFIHAQELAITDNLTGLYNQRFFERMLNSYFNTTRRNKIPLSMIVLDIDYFKVYNDTNGHVAGNEVLIMVASILKESIRKDDLSFRFGGEEFVVLLSSTSKRDAMAVAEKIRTNISEMVFPNEEKQPSGDLTVSLGVASFPEDKDSPAALLHSADLALYVAKKQGRNQVVSFEEDMQ